jgi:hypothetical protein
MKNLVGSLLCGCPTLASMMLVDMVEINQISRCNTLRYMVWREKILLMHLALRRLDPLEAIKTWCSLQTI